MVEAVRKLLGELEYSEIFIEEGQPSNDVGLNHDIYVNNQTFEVYKKMNDVWELKGRTGDVNVNPDWEETDTNKKNYILNKPDVATKDLLQALEDSLNADITDLESLIKSLGVLGFNYDEQEHKVSIVRPNNTVDEGVVFPVCDGLKPGFIDVDTFLQVQQNKKNIIDEIAARVTTDVKSSSFNPLTNTLILERSDESTLEQVLPKVLAGDGINISTDANDNIIVNIGDFELFVPVLSLDSVENPETNKIYLVSNDTGEFDEYIWVNETWELIGSLSGGYDDLDNKADKFTKEFGQIEISTDIPDYAPEILGKSIKTIDISEDASGLIYIGSNDGNDDFLLLEWDQGEVWFYEYTVSEGFQGPLQSKILPASLDIATLAEQYGISNIAPECLLFSGTIVFTYYLEEDDKQSYNLIDVYDEINNLATVAKTGSYEDLSNKPNIPQIIIVADESTAQSVSIDNPDVLVFYPD